MSAVMSVMVAAVATAACSAPDPTEPDAPATSGASTGASTGPSATTSAAEDQAAFEQAMRDKLILPPIPSFTIPTQLLESEENQRISGELDVEPGLYQGIGVVDARCSAAGDASPADSAAPVVGAAGSGHFEDGTRDITVAGDGTGVYDAPGLHIAVLGDGSGVYDDDTTRLTVASDGSGTYSSGDRRLTVAPDGSGSFDDESSRLWVDSDGSGGYEDDTIRVSRNSAGEIFGDGDPARVAAVVEVLSDGLPRFPPVPAVELVEPTGEVCGTVIRLDANVLFDFDRADIKPDGEALLERVATLLSALGSPAAQVNGFTDQVGAEAYNQDLSARRADTVRELLVGYGVEAGSLTSEGLGETQPLRAETRPDGSDDQAARRLNRRVEIVLQD